MDFLTTQTGYEFVYRKGVLNTGEKVTLELKEASAKNSSIPCRKMSPKYTKFT